MPDRKSTNKRLGVATAIGKSGTGVLFIESQLALAPCPACDRSRDSPGAPRHPFCNIQSVSEPTVQGATRSEWPALYKGRNAAMSAQARSRRASRTAFICGVMSLDKDAAIACEPCLAAKRCPAR